MSTNPRHEAPLRAVIYARQSLDKARDEMAVKRQVTACRSLVKLRGFDECMAPVVDNDKSASSGTRRDGYDRLKVLMRERSVDVVVVYAVDRLTLRLRDMADLLDLCKSSGVQVVTVTGDLDLSNDQGRMVAGILASVAQGEVERKGRRQKDANRQRAENGLVLWTRRPYGFDRDGRRVRVVQREAKVVRDIANRVLAGDTLQSIATDLGRRGLLTSTGAPWTVTAVRRAVLNPRVAGRVVSKGEDYGPGGPAILDADTFDRVGAVLRDPARRRRPPSTQPKYLLSGLARCGRPGCDDAVMFATTNGRERTPVYRCRTCYGARRRDLVDQVVLAVVRERLSRPDALGLLEADADLDALRARAVQLRSRRDGLAALLADGLLDAAAVRVQAERLTGELDAVERAVLDATGANPAAKVAAADDVAAALAQLTLVELREVVDALLTVRILPAGKGTRFAPEQVRVEWRTTP